MNISKRARPRVVLAVAGALGLALLAAPHALAADGTPTTPTELFNGYADCSNDANAPTYVVESGLAPVQPRGVAIEGVPGTDAPGTTFLTEQFRVWPVSDPTQTTTLTDEDVATGFEGSALVPDGILTDGQTYAWQAQSMAGTTASDWSAPCYFTLDGTSPSAPPAISSANYQEGQVNEPGEPATFTFDANGVDDVQGFEFAWQSSLSVPVYGIGSYGIPQPAHPFDQYPDTYVRANALGGSATVSLVPPGGPGSQTLYVRSLDRALNVSSTTSYSFSVAVALPTVTPVKPPQFDRPATFALKPNAQLQATSPTVGYTVRTQGGQHDQTVQVQAAPDGTAEVNLTLDTASHENVLVSSTSANGWVSPSAEWTVDFDTTPTVSSAVYPENASGGGVGVPGTFTFAPKVKGVASYTYAFDGGDPVTVKAGPDGRRCITWTPTDSDFNYVNVYATTKDGIQLTDYWYFFTVN